jgi:DNA-binding response OmpR family regulator
MELFDHPPNILVVEDDRALRSLVCRSLKRQGFEAVGVGSGAEMRTVMEETSFDILILDIMLPGSNGLDITRWVRQHSSIPIIIASARDANTDRIVGLELGADDYLTKPFDMDELTARIRALLRRVAFGAGKEMAVGGGILRFEGWQIDRRRRIVTSPEDSQIILSGAEFDLLCALVEAAGRVVGREYLIERSRDRLPASDASDRSIDVLVSRLRRKLSAYEGGRDLIKTVRGVGYVFTGAVEK